LGLSAQQLLAVPIPEQVALMADAFKRLHDQGINPTSLALVMMGRGAKDLAPELMRGREGIEELRQRAEDAGAVMSGETVAALAEMRQSSTLLDASLKSLGGTLMGQVAPGLKEFDDQLAHSVGNMTALVASGGVVKYAVDAIGNALLTAAGYEKLFLAMLMDIGTLSFGTAAKDWKEINDEIEATANQGLGDLDDQLAKAREQYKALIDEASKTQQLKPPPAYGGNQDALRAEVEAINAQVAAQNAYYNQEVERINSLAKTFQIGEQQKVQMLLAAVDQREAFQIAELQQAMSLQGLTQAQYQKFQDKLTEITQKGTADRQKINDQAMQQYVKEWQSGLDVVTSAFNSQLRGLLAGTTTWSTAMRKIVGDLIIQLIEYFEKLAVEKAALGLTNLFGASPQSFIGALLGGSNPATTALTTATTTLTASINALNATLGGGAVVTTAQTTATVAQTSATTAETAATTAETTAQSGGSLGGGLGALFRLFSIPGFDAGTDYVLRSGLAMIHQGETIVPAARGSGPFTGAGRAGDLHVHAPPISISALDSRSVERFFNDNSNVLMRTIRDAVKRGAHLGLSARW